MAPVYRVSFYAGECQDNSDSHVPFNMVKQISPFLVCMKDTDKKSPRCIALSGHVGTQVHCEIYQQRSSACRNFIVGSEACLRARAHHNINANAMSEFLLPDLLTDSITPVSPP